MVSSDANNTDQRMKAVSYSPMALLSQSLPEARVCVERQMASIY